MLKIPYLLATVGKSPTNQTKGAVNKKNTGGDLNILAMIFLTPFISSYCFLVKSMVCETSSLSMFPKCLWWWLCPSLHELKGKWTCIPMILPIIILALMEVKKEKCAMSWNWMKNLMLLNVWIVHPINLRLMLISTIASIS